MGQANVQHRQNLRQCIFIDTLIEPVTYYNALIKLQKPHQSLFDSENQSHITFRDEHKKVVLVP